MRDELTEILARLVDMVHAKTIANPDKVDIGYNLNEATKAIYALIDEVYQRGYADKAIYEETKDK